MVSEAKARRLARVSSVRFEASFGSASEGEIRKHAHDGEAIRYRLSR